MLEMAGQRVVAVAGIGRPAKFFATLRQAGLILLESVAVADHHVYRPDELAKLQARAASMGAFLVTTSKDYARMTPYEQPLVVPLEVRLDWEDFGSVERIMREQGVLF
jgi:tetraacyldisaccharide 4'-kinase